MTQEQSTSSQAATPSESVSPVGEIATPHPALKRLDRLAGTWELTGRTLDATADNMSGRVVIEWLPGGFFLQQRGELDFMGFKAQSLEIVGYDPATDTFTSWVYSSMDGEQHLYHWDVRGDLVTHWTAGSKYTGTFSEDGNTRTGGWRPDEGVEQTAGNTYDAVMTRVQ